MKGRQVALDTINGREAAALIEDGRLSDLLIDGDAPRPGTIYRAVADRPVKGMGGIFCKTPDGQAFLRQVKGIAPGQPVLVQVTGYAERGKAIPVTTKIIFKSRHAIVTPGAPGLNLSRAIRDEEERGRLRIIAEEALEGEAAALILRSSCEGADEDAVAGDIAEMAALARAVMSDTAGDAEKLVEGDGPPDIAWRDWTAPAALDPDEGAFERHGVIEMIEALRSDAVALSGGASLFIEPTRALVAVDVNTGEAGAASGLRANIASARELPRQLRLRGLGGQIVLDPAPMPKKDRNGFESALRAALRADSVETALVGWTPLGHYELQRKRERLPLSELLEGWAP